MNPNKIVISTGYAVVLLIALCAAWNACIVALTLSMYFAPDAISGLEEGRLDLMPEIDSLATIFNYVLPVAILATTAGVVLVKRHALPLFSAGIALALYVATLTPGIALMNHFDYIHGERINIWRHHVWWLDIMDEFSL